MTPSAGHAEEQNGTGKRRRAALPAASELFFRSTSSSHNGDAAESDTPRMRVPRRGSPRSKHDTKITVYVSQEELLALEHARLVLRANHDLTVDRGRLVREAVAVMLRDLDDNGADAVLVRRLRGEEHNAAGEGQGAGKSTEPVA